MRTCPWPGSWTSSVNRVEDTITRVERVLNRLRWKYLRAIALSPGLRDNPARAVSAAFNDAFLSLAGVDRNSCWQDMGFAAQARYELDWDQERKELGAALGEVRRQPATPATYAEIIALKPGFHEAWLHETFPDDAQEGPETPRGKVFAILRSGPLDLTDIFSIDSMDFSDAESFLAYAPCAITEGPFVRRKNPGTSYFDALRRVGTMSSVSDRRAVLGGSFQVLDFRHQLRAMNYDMDLDGLTQEAEFGVPSRQPEI